MVDYILVRKANMKTVQNVTVIQGESSLQQHKLLVGKLQLCEYSQRKRKEVFTPRSKVWRLKEPDFQQAFQDRVKERLANGPETEGVCDVEMVWSSLKECLLDVAEEVCGKTKGRQRHRETWWWNEDVAKFVEEKRRLFRIYNKSKAGWTNGKQEKIRDDMMRQNVLQREKYQKRKRLRGGSLVRC